MASLDLESLMNQLADRRRRNADQPDGTREMLNQMSKKEDGTPSQAPHFNPEPTITQQGTARAGLYSMMISMFH